LSRILLIDIGNTNLKWAWLADGRLCAVTAQSYRERVLKDLCEQNWRQQTAPDRVLVANVAAEELEAELREWIYTGWGLEPEFFRSSARALGVVSAYTDPEQLGVDRWLALIAARHRMALPVCIVDCGTAITLDVLDVSGHHRGGLILPGFNLMRQSLLDNTWIPRATSPEALGLFARDTANAVLSAGVHAAAALVERMLEKSASELGRRPQLVLTGSDAPRLRSVLNDACLVEPDLVMQGLAVAAMEWKE
jgi:type III pantothenate kinase